MKLAFNPKYFSLDLIFNFGMLVERLILGRRNYI